MKKVFREMVGSCLALVFLFCSSTFLYAQDNKKSEEEVRKALKEERISKARPVEVEYGGVLLKKGKMNIVVDEDYAHFSTSEIYIAGFAILPVLVVGEISVKRIKRDIFETSLTTKYGLLDDLQLEFRIPYRYEFDLYSNPEAGWEETKRGGGIGDISGTLYYQILREKRSRPALILGLTGKSRTGRDVFEINYDERDIPEEIATGPGFYSAKGSATLVKTSDPVVIFGTLDYTHNFKRNNIDIKRDHTTADIKPGDTVSFNIGMAYALSYKIAVNTLYQQAYTMRSKKNGEKVINSSVNVAMLKFGVNWIYSKDTVLSFNVGDGLTSDSPDSMVSLSLSYKF